MARLIDAVRLAEELSKRVWYEREDEKQAVRIVKEFPTVDAVPVVRCKDCKHLEQFRPHDGFCKIDGMLNSEAHYCSYGDRKGGNEK